MARAVDYNISPQEFPNLDSEGFEKTSEPTNAYNCIAWSMGSDSRWWWPAIGGFMQYYWPAGVPLSTDLSSFQAAFQTERYEICDHGDLEAEFDKVAIFALNGAVTHAARQLADGRWTSKIGRNIDITHALSALDGPVYGAPVGFMRRAKRG